VLNGYISSSVVVWAKMPKIATAF